MTKIGNAAYLNINGISMLGTMLHMPRRTNGVDIAINGKNNPKCFAAIPKHPTNKPITIKNVFDVLISYTPPLCANPMPSEKIKKTFK